MAVKTKKTSADPKQFIAAIKDDTKRQDALKLLELFESITKEKAAMWGDAIIGFGRYHYTSARSKQEGDWPLTGFSPRASALTVYIMPGFTEYGDLLEKLGPHKKSVSCLYIKKLSDIHLPTLRALIKKSVNEMKRRYPSS